jgi:eukaryotic-like serine/threonine-protein kinase
MASCPTCAGAVPEGSRFCPGCAAPLDATSAETRAGLPASPAIARGTPPSSHPSLDNARFLPGNMVAGRYRIIGLLGRGGMGEVYRADDLKLGQPVALKFLPESVEASPDRLGRFLNEVRLALRITHSNVCRVHDIGEVDGQHYISMEYVDGEDLASLLRRIGRLPQDRGVAIARQICAGLAAAHEQGILHRDLKPANIMIDGRGRARITDFGLADLAGGVEQAEIRSGTPAYMAPEQLAGKEVSERSDIYALGLVLYEIFTGKPAFQATSAVEMIRLQRSTTPSSMSSHVQGLDPAIETVILRALDPDPARRPASALSLAAALPGGDPLAAALAAGETPSPELVAEAGAQGGLSLPVAVTCLAAFVLGMILTVFLAGETQVTRLVPLENSPEVLVHKAQELLDHLGYDEVPVDTSFGFEPDTEVLQALHQGQDANRGWEALREGWPVVAFWYRQGPSYLVPFDRDRVRAVPYDPPRLGPGMIRVWLRPNGRLRYLGVVPPNRTDSPPSDQEPDWSALLEAAGVDLSLFTAVEPSRTPNVQTDTRVAWEGPDPAVPDLKIHVEAGAFRGRPVYFQTHWPWEQPAVAGSTPPSLLARISGPLSSAWYVAVLIGGAVLARRNVRLGRGDRKGALRLALVVLALRLLEWVFAGHHVPGRVEIELFTANMAQALYIAALVWILYLAVEPYFRKFWPRQLASWVRLLDGRFRDPLVGRDVLLGGLLGILFALRAPLYHLLPRWLELPIPRPGSLAEVGIEVTALRGLRHVIALLFGMLQGTVLNVFIGVTMLVLLRLVLRKTWPAVVVWVLVATSLVMQFANGPVFLDLAAAVFLVGIYAVFLLRFGFLSVVTGIFIWILLSYPLSFDLSAWYANGSLVALLACLSLMLYAFRVSLGRGPLFREEPARS